jgi:hypothetical protein
MNARGSNTDALRESGRIDGGNPWRSGTPNYGRGQILCAAIVVSTDSGKLLTGPHHDGRVLRIYGN